MHKFSLLFLLFIGHIVLFAQTEESSSTASNYVSDRDAKYAVSQILLYCGLEPNFTIVVDFKIPNAQAYIHRKKRYIRYNPNFMNRIVDSTYTDWAAWSVLAHELGHHLLGHTIQKYKFSHENELAADRFSGFILKKMGANLEESIACIQKEGNLHGSKSHPSLKQRKEAIVKGWEQAEYLEQNDVCVSSLNYLENNYLNENFTHTLKFNGDLNSYYINEIHQIIWYDNYGNAVLLSSLSEHEGKSYEWDFMFENSHYSIDASGKVWLMAIHGATILVGKTAIISAQDP
ncbi:hypothetical protein [Parvicella tangerina]|uniref:Peptidase M48 domain-containing protein n=1 Tax=Parvicella tangerina TaxID=2829795 RepID=A0A916N9W9_9FLAO|nr:hypothetical protein [Parvicella tangerina]CAG5078035.1 hypothetical protein CRYO30217_00551 [Parvicella tangerina]